MKPRDMMKVSSWTDEKHQIIGRFHHELNTEFLDVFLYYRNREHRPLGSMQAKIAVACKAIRVFFVIMQTGCDFDEERELLS